MKAEASEKKEKAAHEQAAAEAEIEDALKKEADEAAAKKKAEHEAWLKFDWKAQHDFVDGNHFASSMPEKWLNNTHGPVPHHTG